VGGVKDMVVENTPPFVTEAIDTTVGVLEEARTAAGTFFRYRERQGTETDRRAQ